MITSYREKTIKNRKDFIYKFIYKLLAESFCKILFCLTILDIPSGRVKRESLFFRSLHYASVIESLLCTRMYSESDDRP